VAKGIRAVIRGDLEECTAKRGGATTAGIFHIDDRHPENSRLSQYVLPDRSLQLCELRGERIGVIELINRKDG
jgi:hypothetical protein